MIVITAPDDLLQLSVYDIDHIISIVVLPGILILVSPAKP